MNEIDMSILIIEQQYIDKQLLINQWIDFIGDSSINLENISKQALPSKNNY